MNVLLSNSMTSTALGVPKLLGSEIRLALSWRLRLSQNYTVPSSHQVDAER